MDSSSQSDTCTTQSTVLSYKPTRRRRAKCQSRPAVTSLTGFSMASQEYRDREPDQENNQCSIELGGSMPFRRYCRNDSLLEIPETQPELEENAGNLPSHQSFQPESSSSYHTRESQQFSYHAGSSPQGLFRRKSMPVYCHREISRSQGASQLRRRDNRVIHRAVLAGMQPRRMSSVLEIGREVSSEVLLRGKDVQAVVRPQKRRRVVSLPLIPPFLKGYMSPITLSL